MYSIHAQKVLVVGSGGVKFKTYMGVAAAAEPLQEIIFALEKIPVQAWIRIG